MAILDCDPYLLVSAIAMIIYIFYRYMNNTYSKLQNLGIPGPKPKWILGNVLEFKGKEAQVVFKRWKEMYGNVYGFYEGFRAGIVINDPDLAKEILSKSFDKFYVRTVPGSCVSVLYTGHIKEPDCLFIKELGRNAGHSCRPFMYYPDNLQLINIHDGQYWKNQRNVFSKTLNSGGTMQQLTEKVQKTSVKFVKSLHESSQKSPSGFDISELVERYTVETIMRMVLNLSDSEIAEHGQMIYEYEMVFSFSASADNEVAGLARLFPALTPMFKLADKKHKTFHDKMIAFLRKHIQKVIAEMNDNSDDDSSLLSQLLASKVPTHDVFGSVKRRDLADNEILAHLSTFITESYHTTMSAIKYLLYELACNPDCQEQLYDEICRTFEQSDVVTLSKLQDMQYFDMVFNETYRLHPVAPGLSRTCTEDCTINGYQFKKGMVVRIMTCAMYNDKNYFPDENSFIPERFSEKNRAKLHPFVFLPFGHGPRMCPGQKIAMLQVKTFIIDILKHFQLETCKNTQVPLRNALRPTLCPAGEVNLCLKKRCGM